MRAEVRREQPATPPIKEVVLVLSKAEAMVLYALANVNVTVAEEADRVLTTRFASAYNPGTRAFSDVLIGIYNKFRDAGLPSVCMDKYRSGSEA